MTGIAEPIVGDDVGGREAELAPPLVAADDLPSTMNGAPRQRRAASTSPAAISALIRVEETVSPSTSTSGTTRVSNSSRAASISASPFALAPKRKFSPTETRSAPSLSSSTCSTKSSALRWAKSSVEGDHDQLLDAEAFDHVALDPEGHDQLRRAAGCRTSSGCGSKVRTVSAPSITA